MNLRKQIFIPSGLVSIMVFATWTHQSAFKMGLNFNLTIAPNMGTVISWNCMY